MESRIKLKDKDKVLSILFHVALAPNSIGRRFGRNPTKVLEEVFGDLDLHEDDRKLLLCCPDVFQEALQNSFELTLSEKPSDLVYLKATEENCKEWLESNQLPQKCAEEAGIDMQQNKRLLDEEEEETIEYRVLVTKIKYS